MFKTVKAKITVGFSIAIAILVLLFGMTVWHEELAAEVQQAYQADPGQTATDKESLVSWLSDVVWEEHCKITERSAMELCSFCL